MTEKFNQLSNNLETQKNFSEKKFNSLTMLIDKLSEKIQEKTDLEKFEEKLKQSLKNMQDLNVKLEIKFNIMNKDLKDACFRYDKIISNNLLVPGIVGPGCTYENLRNFIEFSNGKIAELVKSKEKQNIDAKLYKDKMEGLIKQNQYQFDTMNIKFANLIEEEIKKSDKFCKERIASVYNKIEKDKMNNDKIMEEYKLIFDKFQNDFSRFYQEDWINNLNLVNNLNNKISKNIEDFLTINIKLKEMEELMKRNLTKRNSIVHKSNSIIYNENIDKNGNNDIINDQKNRRISIKRLDIKRATNKTNINNITSKRNDSSKQVTHNKNVIESTKENKIFNKTFNKNEEQKITNIQKKSENKNIRDEKNNELNFVKSRNVINNEKKFTNLYEARDKNDNNNINNNIIKKLDFKALNIKKRIFKDNINENNKIHENTNYDSNDVRGNSNDSFFFKLINFNDVFNNKNKFNNIKTTKGKEIGNNFSNNKMDFRNKFNSNFSVSDNLRLNNFSIGSEFSENDLHFVNNTKHNLSQAYFLAKARLEDQQRSKHSKIFSNISLNGNNEIKSQSKNKNKFNSKDNKNNKLEEKGKSPDKNSLNHSSIIDNTQEFFNMNFPLLYKNPQDIPDFHKSILEKKVKYLSYMNDNIENKNNSFNKDSNKTQIDFDNVNEINNINREKMNRNKKMKNFRMAGSSSGVNILFKMDSLTPNNYPNPFLNRSNNRERSYDLIYDKGSAKATLNYVNSILIKKFKEDFV